MSSNLKKTMSLLNPDEHWLGWLGSDPRSAVHDELERIFQQQVKGSKLEQLIVTEAPTYFTGGKPSADQSGVLVVRAGLAVPFDAIVAESKDIHHQVCGVFSWVAVNLDGEKERRDRTWLDLGDDAQLAAELLKARMYFDSVDGL